MVELSTVALFLFTVGAAVKMARTAFGEYEENKSAAERQAQRRKQDKLRRLARIERERLKQRSRVASKKARRLAERRARALLLESLSDEEKAARKQRRESQRVLKRCAEAHSKCPQWEPRLRLSHRETQKLQDLRAGFHEIEAASGRAQYAIVQCDRFLEECTRARERICARSTYFKDAQRWEKVLPRLVDYLAIPENLPHKYGLVWAKCKVTPRRATFVLPCGIRATLDPADADALSHLSRNISTRKRVYVRSVDYRECSAVISISMVSMLAQFKRGADRAYPGQVLRESAGGYEVLVKGLVQAHLPRMCALQGESCDDGTIAVRFYELDHFFDKPLVQQVPVRKDNPINGTPSAVLKVMSGS